MRCYRAKSAWFAADSMVRGNARNIHFWPSAPFQLLDCIKARGVLVRPAPALRAQTHKSQRQPRTFWSGNKLFH
jgi:hypothetical protein